MEIEKIAEAARVKLSQLTGFTSPHTIGIRCQANVWHITVEITEKPSTACNLDLLGIYLVHIDADENIIGYERIGMRKRCEMDN